MYIPFLYIFTVVLLHYREDCFLPALKYKINIYFSYLEETTLADADSFKKEFYKGEIRRQKLEIKKLQLEIRALQRNEFESFSQQRGSGENEDAPPRPRIRFAARGMPFPFFRRK